MELERFKIFTFKGTEYKIEVPTIGQYLEIEDEKIINSNGHWLELIKSKTVSAFRSVQIIECISLLKILCPNLFNNLNVKSYRDIDVIDFVDLLKIYQTEIFPWYNNWFNTFNEILVESTNTDEEKKD